MVGDTVHILRDGGAPVPAEVVVDGTTMLTVQTHDGLFTVSRDGKRSRRSGWRLHLPSDEERAAAAREQAAQHRRQGVREAQAAFAAVDMSDVAAWDDLREALFHKMVADVLGMFKTPTPTRREP